MVALMFIAMVVLPVALLGSVISFVVIGLIRLVDRVPAAQRVLAPDYHRPGPRQPRNARQAERWARRDARDALAFDRVADRYEAAKAEARAKQRARLERTGGRTA